MEESREKQYWKKCQNAESMVKRFKGQIEALSNGDIDFLMDEEVTDKEWKDLVVENKKLKYRINILKRTIAEIEQTSATVPKNCEVSFHGEHMVSIFEHLESFFAAGVSKAFPDIQVPANLQIQLSKVADYQCNVAMSLVKVLNCRPKDIANSIVANIGKSPIVSALELSGPGFINITLDREFIQQQTASLVTKGVTPPPTKKQKVIVDFSSPNIAKEMHVGHLRSTIIGDCIARLLEFLGHDVLRINHLGDWGTQFGMLIAHLKDEFPDFQLNMPPISNLQAFYKESKKRFDEDEDFKKRAYEAVVKLQSHDPEHLKAWEEICNVSMKEFNKIYDRLGVRINPQGESFYQSRMNALVDSLEAKGMLSEEEGRKVMYADGANIPLTVVKSDGGYTYDTSDLACLRHRIEEKKGDWLIYVTDAGQADHFKAFLLCGQRAGFYDPQKTRVDHVTFGVVLGEDKKKFKTRLGDTVRLLDLLEEGVQRSEEVLKEKERDSALTSEEFQKAKEAVAYGCIKYADLCHDRTRDYVFSFDRMLDFRGNTAAYLLYALTRIRSISRTAGLPPEAVHKAAADGKFALEHEKEWKLAKTLLKLPDVILKLTQDLYLHPLCDFLYEVSTTFTEFYDNCYCVEKDSSGTVVKINMSRILLCEATAVVMQKCFDILGIETLSKM